MGGALEWTALAMLAASDSRAPAGYRSVMRWLINEAPERRHMIIGTAGLRDREPLRTGGLHDCRHGEGQRVRARPPPAAHTWARVAGARRPQLRRLREYA